MVRRVDGMRNVVEIKTDKFHIEFTAFTDGDVETWNLAATGPITIDMSKHIISPALVGRE